MNRFLSLIGILATVSAFAQNSTDPINPSQTAVVYRTGDTIVTPATHDLQIIKFSSNSDGESIPSVVRATNKDNGKVTFIGVNTQNKKKAFSDVINAVISLQVPILGVQASIEFLKTVEIGLEAGQSLGQYYGGYANIHIINFKVDDDSQWDLYIGSHYRNRVNVPYSFGSNGTGTLSGSFGDVRIGVRRFDKTQRFYQAFEVGYGKFLGDGALYTANPHPGFNDENLPNGSIQERATPVFRVVFGMRLFKQ